MGRLVAFVLIAALPISAKGADWHGIPAGWEPLLKTMLGHGASLPDGCRFDGGSNAAFVTAEYVCNEGRVTVQLRNPDDAPPDATRTQRFALVARDGAPPPGLLDALAALVRAHEAELMAGLPPSLVGRLSAAAAIVLLVMGLQAAIERRWARRDPRPPAPTAVHGATLYILLTVALAAAFLLSRIAFLERLPAFNDEATHIRWAQAAVGAYFVPEMSVGKWLPLQWMALFVRLPIDALVGARLASVSMGLVTLLACVWINRELFGWTEGLVAGVVYAIVPFALFYDRVALADVYVSAFAAWSVFFATAMRRRTGLGYGLGLTLCLFATILSKPTGGVFLLTPLLVGAWLVARDQRASYLRRSLPAVIGGGGFLVFLLFGGYGTELIAAQATLDGAGGLDRFLANLAAAREWLVPLFTPAIVWATAAASLFAVMRLFRDAWEEAFLLALLALSFVPYALVSTIWYPRYVVFMVVPVALLVARTIAAVASSVGARVGRRSPSADGATSGLVLASMVLALVVASAPRSAVLLTDPARAGLPDIERRMYVSGCASGYGLPELAVFLEEQARRSPINVVAFAGQGPPNEGIDAYLGANERVHRQLVDKDLEVAAGQVANLARTRRTLFVLNEADGERSVAPPTYLGRAERVWTYTRPGGESALEVWEALPGA